MRELMIVLSVMGLWVCLPILIGIWSDPEVKLWIKLLTTFSVWCLGIVCLATLFQVV